MRPSHTTELIGAGRNVNLWPGKALLVGVAQSLAAAAQLAVQVR